MPTLIGVNPTATITSSEYTTKGVSFGLGDRHTDHIGNEWVFVQASGAITKYDAVLVKPSYLASSLTPALAITPGFIGFAQVAFADTDYGWVMTRGIPVIRVANGCPSNVPLYTTDTAGVLDRLTGSLSQYQVQGVVTDYSVSSSLSFATAGASFPLIRRPQA